MRLWNRVVRVLAAIALAGGGMDRASARRRRWRAHLAKQMGVEGIRVAMQKELMRRSTMGMTLRHSPTFDAPLKDASSRVAKLVFANGSPDGSRDS